MNSAASVLIEVQWADSRLVNCTNPWIQLDLEIENP